MYDDRRSTRRGGRADRPRLAGDPGTCRPSPRGLRRPSVDAREQQRRAPDSVLDDEALAGLPRPAGSAKMSRLAAPTYRRTVCARASTTPSWSMLNVPSSAVGWAGDDLRRHALTLREEARFAPGEFFVEPDAVRPRAFTFAERGGGREVDADSSRQRTTPSRAAPAVSAKGLRCATGGRFGPRAAQSHRASDRGGRGRGASGADGARSAGRGHRPAAGADRADADRAGASDARRDQ